MSCMQYTHTNPVMQCPTQCTEGHDMHSACTSTLCAHAIQHCGATHVRAEKSHCSLRSPILSPLPLAQ